MLRSDNNTFLLSIKRHENRRVIRRGDIENPVSAVADASRAVSAYGYEYVVQDSVRRCSKTRKSTRQLQCSCRRLSAWRRADLANPSWESRVDHSCRERCHPACHPPPTFTLLCVGDLDPGLSNDTPLKPIYTQTDLGTTQEQGKDRAEPEVGRARVVAAEALPLRPYAARDKAHIAVRSLTSPHRRQIINM
ncbi:unnamed protein product, partial [Iphiclides podalirius]